MSIQKSVSSNIRAYYTDSSNTIKGLRYVPTPTRNTGHKNRSSGILTTRGASRVREDKKSRFECSPERIRDTLEERGLPRSVSIELARSFALAVNSAQSAADLENAAADALASSYQAGLPKVVAPATVEDQALAELPPVPTEKYVGNRGGSPNGENIEQFMRRVWKDWFPAPAGNAPKPLLTRKDLRDADPKAAQAISNWERKLPWPDELPVLTKKQLVDEELEGAGDMRKARRLSQAAYRRKAM
ncbi:hypothetical protein [Stakelama tenebrarum]|uniref:Uncharacterized protein n=1 Tax=Stakelama tenebrarum TaxID=2711215 RepID=A0A6G6Y4J0_9SPHN|nr:hypothetical protein [Sphingosinithalassobacter tenebrarum]QIG79638.1 hypothetical protein G5C33_07430 [Sphingosinithalassobacter tenebrarum]